MGLLKLKDVIPPEKPTEEELAQQQQGEAPDASEVNPDQGGQMPQPQATDQQAAMAGGGGAGASPPGAAPPAGVAPPPAGAVPQGQPQQDNRGAENLSDEQLQQVYEKVIVAAGKIMFSDPTTHGQIMKTLHDGARNLPQTIGSVAVNIITSIDEKSGRTLPPPVIGGAIIEITEQVCELANSAGMKVDERVMGQAGQAAIAGLAEAYDITPAEVQQFMAQFTPAEVEPMRAQQNEVANGGEAGGAQPPQAAPTGPPPQAAPPQMGMGAQMAGAMPSG